LARGGALGVWLWGVR